MKGKVLETAISLVGKIDPSLEKAMTEAQNRLEGVNVKALAVGAAVGTAVGVGVVKGSKYLAQLGNDYNKSLNSLQAQTGATAAEMQDFGDVIKDVYKNNYGENFEEVSAGVSQITRMTGLTGDALQATTEGAFALSDAFEYDVSESARAAKAMMTNFGVKGEEAMNYIASGAQNGLDFSGELLDSVSEYSVQFAKLGFSADDMFNIFQQGADSGAWNLDKVGDAIKEFSIRSIDGSNTSAEAFKALGLDADEMFEMFTRGGEDANSAFKETITRLMDMDDKVARDAAGVGLFGTMWEDLGTDAMQALADMENGAYDAGDALKSIQNVKYNDLDSAMQAIWRNIEVGLLPIASELANRLMEATPEITATLEKVIPIISTAAGVVFPLLGDGINLVADGIGFVSDHLNILAPIAIGAAAAFGAFKLATLLSTAAMGPATAALTVSGVATGAWTTVSGLATTATTALGAAFRFMTGPIGIIITVIGAVVAAGVALYKNWDTVKAKAVAVGNWLKTTWTNVSTSLKGIVDGIKEHFRAGFASLVGYVKAPINAVIGAVNGVVSSINGVGIDIPDWVPIIGGKSFRVSIPSIPMLAAGGFTDGLSIAGEAGTEAVISFDPQYRDENISYWAKAGQMLGADSSDYTLESSTSNSGGTVVIENITFAPHITVQEGDKDSVIEAIREEYPEFLDMLEEWFGGRGDFEYV